MQRNQFTSLCLPCICMYISTSTNTLIAAYRTPFPAQLVLYLALYAIRCCCENANFPYEIAIIPLIECWTKVVEIPSTRHCERGPLDEHDTNGGRSRKIAPDFGTKSVVIPTYLFIVWGVLFPDVGVMFCSCKYNVLFDTSPSIASHRKNDSRSNGNFLLMLVSATSLLVSTYKIMWDRLSVYINIEKRMFA